MADVLEVPLPKASLRNVVTEHFAEQLLQDDMYVVSYGIATNRGHLPAWVEDTTKKLRARCWGLVNIEKLCCTLGQGPARPRKEYTVSSLVEAVEAAIIGRIRSSIRLDAD